MQKRKFIQTLAVALLLITPATWAADAASTAAQSMTFKAIDTQAPATTRSALAKARPVTAEHAMVVTAQHLATQVGVSILKAGGNAVDAAVAVGFALAVVQPCCGNIGGGGFMTLRLDGKSMFLDFREKAPLQATTDMYLDKKGNVVKGLSTGSWLGVGVPGTVLGLVSALKKYGSMSLPAVMAPAIKLARDGFILRPGDVSILHKRSDDFAQHANVAAIFLNDGKPWQVGDRLVQTQLAASLALIAKHGAKAFYTGKIAHALVQASSANGGILSLKDLADYTVQWTQPLSCDYQGYQVISAPPPSSGGATICEILKIIEPAPLHQWGYGSVKTVHYLAEAERRAFADRNTYLGDPAFVYNPIEALLSARHIDKLRGTITPNRATPSFNVMGKLASPEGNNTTHYSIVDAAGNAVAVTYTINYLFGIAQMAGDTGFFLNNEMDDFTSKPGVPNSFGLVQGRANQIEPGKRPLSSMSPTILLKNGKVFMVTGSPGGSTIISTTLQSILNVIDFGMNVQQAVNAPRLHQQWWPQQVFVEPGLLTPDASKKLAGMGYNIKQVKAWGAAEAITVDPASGQLQGANDRRRSAGLAAGY